MGDFQSNWGVVVFFTHRGRCVTLHILLLHLINMSILYWCQSTDIYTEEREYGKIFPLPGRHLPYPECVGVYVCGCVFDQTDLFVVCKMRTSLCEFMIDGEVRERLYIDRAAVGCGLGGCLCVCVCVYYMGVCVCILHSQCCCKAPDVWEAASCERYMCCGGLARRWERTDTKDFITVKCACVCFGGIVSVSAEV